jgi:hypothetical protein
MTPEKASTIVLAMSAHSVGIVRTKLRELALKGLRPREKKLANV